MVSYKIEEIEGIGPGFAAKLRVAAIATVADLLEACCDAKGRKGLATSTGIDEDRLLRWTNMADLMRIKGIGKQYAELLKASGVDTVKELKMRKAANLATRMVEVNAQKKLSGAVPTEGIVAGWIEQAKELPARVSY